MHTLSAELYSVVVELCSASPNQRWNVQNSFGSVPALKVLAFFSGQLTVARMPVMCQFGHCADLY
jgi:hypothetical protein